MLRNFIVYKNQTIIDTLRTIDNNKCGFAIVVDDNFKVWGTITDGDIRRAFIKGSSVDDVIDGIYTVDFRFLEVNNDIEDAIDIFKDKQIGFLPILDREHHLHNVITRRQLHAVLLQDVHADINYNFVELNDNIVDLELYQRPWGFYKTTVLTDFYQSKVITIKPGQKLSLQSHNHREEHWVVVHGEGVVQIDASMVDVRNGSSVFIPKGAKHRITNSHCTENLIITEVQIGDYLGEDDIERYDDIYGRI